MFCYEQRCSSRKATCEEKCGSFFKRVNTARGNLLPQPERPWLILSMNGRKYILMMDYITINMLNVPPRHQSHGKILK